MTTVTIRADVNIDLGEIDTDDLKGELDDRGYACVEIAKFSIIEAGETELLNIKQSVREIFDAYKIGDESRAQDLSIALAEDITGGTIT